MTVMDDAELCKSDGNTFFSSGDVPAAINSYRRGLDILRTSSTKDDDAINALRLSLYSNLANAYLSSCDYDASCEAAEQAMAIDPSAIKPAIRWVEARRRSGFSFEALVHDLLRLRPLLRTAVARGAITIKEATTLRMQVEEPLFAAVGLVNVSDGFELIQHAGGVAMVSQRTFGPNEVLFCEKKYRTSFDASLDLEADCTTERIAARFATRLRPEQKQQSEEWRTFRDQFRGAWPRSADEVDEETKTMVGAHLRRELPDLNDDDLQELLLASLMCRYNCFHSGFFRTCALANHSCHANIAMKYNPNEETVTMITVRDIKPGDLMNVKYLNDAHFLMGLGHRREFLRSWLFWCGCDRCVADAAPTAVQEQVVCARCGRCTHYPLFMPNTELHTDPMKKSEEGACCQHCHERVEWSDERDALARQIASSLLQNSQHASPGQLTAWIRVQLKLLGSVQLHPAHWLYRVLFYFSCVPLTSMIDGCTARFTPTCTSGELTELFDSCGLAEHYLPRLEKMIAAESESSDRSTASLLWVNEPILHNIAAGPAPEGCDALRVLELLWHFISSFYPPYEMWAIHRAVCQLVLLHLVSRHGAGRTVPLTNHTALLLLERHGPYVGDVDARRWMHLFTQHRKAAEAVGPLPPLAKLKKAFRLK